MKHAEGEGRPYLLEGLRHRLHTSRLRPKASSGWDEADIICNSALFWQARMVSYEAWRTLYLSLACKPLLARMTLPAGIVFVLLMWSVLAAAGAIVGFLVIILFEGWHFARKIRLALTEESRQSLHA